jgi:hypothetical protein
MKGKKPFDELRVRGRIPLKSDSPLLRLSLSKHVLSQVEGPRFGENRPERESQSSGGGGGKSSSR